MRNNKGFAISLMLYAMILLIVTIFYIVLAIVKNRFTYSEDMVNNVVNFLELHDETMGHGDRTGPLVVFTPGSTAFSDDNRYVIVDIYDDNDGQGIKVDSIKIKINNTFVYTNSKVNNSFVPEYSFDDKNTCKHAQFKIKMPNNTPPSQQYNFLYVSVQDKSENYSQTLPRIILNDKNTYSYQSYAFTTTGPTCSIKGPYKRIKEFVKESDEEIKPPPNGSNVTEHKNDKYYYYHLYYVDITISESNDNDYVPSGEDVYYSIECSGYNGINAYLNPSDFEDNDNLKVQNVIVIKGINRTKAIVQVKATYPATTPGDITSELKLDKKHITDSIGNPTGNLVFPSVRIRLVNEEIKKETNP